jgi:pimeloyl-ACP methyl ester carboxylesterase
MIYGKRDMIPQFKRLPEFVPNVGIISLDCGHCIQQEMPEETNRVILKWLEEHNA